MKLKSRIDQLETSRGSQVETPLRPSDIPSDLVSPLVSALTGDAELTDSEFMDLLAKAALGAKN